MNSNALPDQFCIAIVGHSGWSRDPYSTARYALVVTFEIPGLEISMYEPLRAAVLELQTRLEMQVAVEAEAEVELEECAGEFSFRRTEDMITVLEP